MAIKLSRQNYPSSSRQSQNFPNSEELENIISKIVKSDERQEIESMTFLSLHDLIVPSLKQKRTGPPRAQNCFLIFRKDLQANMKSQSDNIKMTSSGQIFKKYLRKYLHPNTYMTSPDDKTSGMKMVSNTAFRMWQYEDEIKQVYVKVSQIAKAVHAFMWPNYKYKPNRKKRLQNSFSYRHPYISMPSTPSCSSQNLQPYSSPFTYSCDFVSYPRVLPKQITQITQLDINPNKLNYYNNRNNNDRILCQSVDRHVKI
ncbi:9101_t:CDS:1 [Scutellospora calospora]|uniref:9101_t:CDS:1 n=1 Tax=Scutellospora calospora TaxID=85575 RepID=A0ACA9LEY6_9GLOM|nr:9101_t:CDS:1 [Scutellospora calospora]